MRHHVRTVLGTTYAEFFSVVYFLSISENETRNQRPRSGAGGGADRLRPSGVCYANLTHSLASSSFFFFVMLLLLQSVDFHLLKRLCFVSAFLSCVGVLVCCRFCYRPSGGVLSGGGSSGVEEERRRHRQRHHGAHHGLGRGSSTLIVARQWGGWGEGGERRGRARGHLKKAV